MSFERGSGILMHPTSFPGRYGIGDLGQAAYDFVDFLKATGQKIWQVMPLNPTGYGDSPYQCFSAFAGNPYLISPDKLVEDKLLNPEDVADVPNFPKQRVDYGPVIDYKVTLLQNAYEGFKKSKKKSLIKAFDEFKKENDFWLKDFALFMAIKTHHGGELWQKWDEKIALREPDAVKKWQKKLADEIEAHAFYQFIFFRQWVELKKYAHHNGVRIMGDIPIFVAYDSSDVWSNREMFFLDEQGSPTVVAGVPPDYFSATGQRWGNPLYNWKFMEKDQFKWWIKRFHYSLNLYDIIRLDHFRGFAAYWEVPATEDTAMNGKWVKAPGLKLFKALREALGKIPIIAEDLGVITPDVDEMRLEFEFPGMKVLQFAFGGDPECPDLPHNFETRNCIVYTGTHDNNTTRGWYLETSTAKERDYVRRYLGIDGHDISWDLIRLAMSSIADLAVFPMQDLLNLGNEARMNFPSTVQGNWSWRLLPDQITDHLRQRLYDMTVMYARFEDPVLAAEKKEMEKRAKEMKYL